MRFGSVLWRTQRAARLQCFEYLRQKSISLISRTEPGNFLLKRSTGFRDLVFWDAARSANRVRDLKPIRARLDPLGLVVGEGQGVALGRGDSRIGAWPLPGLFSVCYWCLSRLHSFDIKLYVKRPSHQAAVNFSGQEGQLFNETGANPSGLINPVTGQRNLDSMGIKEGLACRSKQNSRAW
jgi:hypothetical protein